MKYSYLFFYCRIADTTFIQLFLTQIYSSFTITAFRFKNFNNFKYFVLFFKIIIKYFIRYYNITGHCCLILIFINKIGKKYSHKFDKKIVA